MKTTECRPGCAACCVVPSISSPIPNMPKGKAAGIPCVQLTDTGLCAMYGKPERPAVCGSLQPTPEMCGLSREEALAYLAALEAATAPGPETTR
jgi:uncharacterized protein